MKWHRIHYTYGPVEDTIDVLSEPHSFDTFLAVLRSHRGVDPKTAALDITNLGEGDGTLAPDYDPRDSPPNDFPFEFRGQHG